MKRIQEVKFNINIPYSVYGGKKKNQEHVNLNSVEHNTTGICIRLC